MSTDRPHIRTFIYGSCVSRDTFEFLRPLGYSLVEYVARQSLVSAFGRPHAVDGLDMLPSDFQRRMLRWDAESALAPILSAHTHDVDLVLWDLFDERLGVRLMRDSGSVTRTVEGIAAGIDERIGGTVLPFGADAHLQQWEHAVREWNSLLERLNLRRKVILLAPPWAETSSAGGSSPSSFGRSPAAANTATTRYLELARKVAQDRVVTLEREQTRSHANHKWGEAPFHYVEANYRTMATRIDAVTRTFEL